MHCPQCGAGKLFQSYLKSYPACLSCGEDLSQIRADDGPAWLTVMVTGHLIVPVSIYLSMHDLLRPSMALPLLLFFTLLAVLVILPRAKGIFIGMIWLMRKTRNKTTSKYDTIRIPDPQ